MYQQTNHIQALPLVDYKDILLWKKVWTVEVNISNNIYKTNNNLSTELSEHRKATTYNVGSWCHSLGQAPKWVPTLSLFIQMYVNKIILKIRNWI
jgi:hypothetical protein